MMCNSPMVLFEVLSGLMFLAVHAVATEVIPATEPIKGNYIVTYNTAMKSQVTEEDIIELINGGATSIFGGNDNKLLHMYDVIDGFAAALSPEGLANVLGSDLVDSVYEDGTVHASTEWGLDRIDQRDLPVDNSYNPGFGNNGDSVTAYVIDTGILDTHEKFEGRATQAMNFLSGESNVDCNGHGTHVAGTIGAKTYGVAKKSELVGLKVLGCSGAGSYTAVIAAINWVKANHNKPAVVNMSLGGPGSYSPLATAIENLVAEGVSVVVAAGNDKANACNYVPSYIDAAITVGSTTISDQRSSFSNWGTCVDIFAPGSWIKSTWIGSNSATNTISGTSMASPHVCGAVALYLGENDDLTPQQIRDKLLENTTNGKITDIKSGSPNELLYVGGIAPTMPPVTEPTPSPVTPPSSLSPVSRPTSTPSSLSPVSALPTPVSSSNCAELCYENEQTRFLLKVKNNEPKYETCAGLAKMNKNQRGKICKKERKSLDGYGPASVHCRVTCSKWKTTECKP